MPLIAMTQEHIWITLLCVFQILIILSYAIISIRNEKFFAKLEKERKETEAKFLAEQKAMRRELKGILGEN